MPSNLATPCMADRHFSLAQPAGQKAWSEDAAFYKLLASLDKLRTMGSRDAWLPGLLQNCKAKHMQLPFYLEGSHSYIIVISHGLAQCGSVFPGKDFPGWLCSL